MKRCILQLKLILAGLFIGLSACAQQTLSEATNNHIATFGRLTHELSLSVYQIPENKWGEFTRTNTVKQVLQPYPQINTFTGKFLTDNILI